MPNLRKLFSHVVVAVFAVGSVACPCPAKAASEAAPHAHHQGQQESSAEVADSCDHSGCMTDCSRMSADASPQDASLLFRAKLQFDDWHAIPPDTTAWAARSSPLVTWTGPLPRRIWLSHDTPVRRFDRLLD